MKQNSTRGFTLVELLVVIAIIGILSAIVLASLNLARYRANDTAIKADMDTVRIQAELYYYDNVDASGNNTYGLRIPIVGSGINCSVGTNMFTDSTINRAIKAADSANGSGGVFCSSQVAIGNSPSYYIIGAQLTTPGSGWWCIDSTRTAVEVKSMGWPAKGSAVPAPCPAN